MSVWLIINWLVFLAVAAYALYLFGYVVYSRYQFISLGRKAPMKKQYDARLKEVWINVFGQKKLLKDKKSGLMHVIMFYGFIVLQFGAVDLFIKGLAPGHHLPVPAYPAFTFVQEIVTLLVLMATVYAAYRRFGEKLARLKQTWKAGLVIWFLTSLMVSILMSAAFDVVWQKETTGWAHPVASLLALPLLGLSDTAAMVGFYAFWWMHALVLFAFLVYVPQSKHAHLIAAPINVFLKRQDPPGKLENVDFEDEEAESFGKNKIEQFDRNELLDLYACVECGRCTDVCPAAGTGKMLSPMDLIVKMRDHLTEKGSAITSRSPWMPAFAFAGANQTAMETAVTRVNEAADRAHPEYDYPVQLIGDVITESELWACTTCRNCEDACPVSNEHVGKIVDMRRYLVLTEGKMPPEVSRTFQNIERQSNPWGINRKERVKWVEGREELTVPTVKQVESFEYLFWVGSMGSFDSRSTKVSEAFVRLLHEAEVSFAILGNEEKNSGDVARRMGNDFLFQQLAAENIATFQKYKVKKIVTCDPHAYNTFKHEYPDFGLEGVDVYHHTELLARLLEEGRLEPRFAVNERITYHDSCYLGRYNDQYDAPRTIISRIPGAELVEMARSRENAMCCGAGGGMMWMEETDGIRVNVARTEQAMAVNPSTIASACPYCLTMMSDGTKAKEVEDKVHTKDVAEILAESVFGPGGGTRGKPFIH